jgi:hypothetical protein
MPPDMRLLRERFATNASALLASLECMDDVWAADTLDVLRHEMLSAEQRFWGSAISLLALQTAFRNSN